jgi:acyl-CoA synthetase (AMP-forming)/AMP-acid ligase II
MLADDGRRYLRTGDLGFLYGDEIVITGRLSDIIIVRGRNLYPQDIELVAEEAHPLIRRHCSAAFPCTAASGQTAVGMVLEVEPTDEDELTQIIAAVHEQVLKELDVQVHSIALVGPGSVPKTTSGKTQRKLCAKRAQDGELELYAVWDQT